MARYYYAAGAMIVEFLWLPVAQKDLSSAFEGDAVLWCIVDGGAFNCSVVVRGACVVNLQAALGHCCLLAPLLHRLSPKLPSLRDQ